MKVITCASYHGTGSSALTDLMTEYSSVKSLGDYEFPFAYMSDGISDLEFHLTECHNRHGSGYALKQFEKISKFNAGTWFNKRYEPFFNGKYWELTEKYINELLDFKLKGHHMRDALDRGVFFYYFQNIVTKLFKKIGIDVNFLPGEYLYHSHPSKEKFLRCTRHYTHQLLEAANNSNTDWLMIDQLMPSSNIMRCLRYFEDEIYTFVVDRDPRDVYLTNKYVWKENVVPTDPHMFCKWYKYIHDSSKNESWDNSKVMKINFEDLIYRYNDAVSKIESFLGISSVNHYLKFTKLNPKRSVNNTRLWEKYHDKGVSVLEKELFDYLYDSSFYNKDEVQGVETNEKGVF